MITNKIVSTLLYNDFKITVSSCKVFEYFVIQYSIDWFEDKLSFEVIDEYTIKILLDEQSGVEIDSFEKLAELYFKTWKTKNKFKPNSAALDLLWIPIGLNYNLIQEKTITIYEPNNV